MSPTYPDDCVQTLTSTWWIEDKADSIVRGHLLWVWIPYPEMKPYRLVPEGRGDDARQHARAHFRIETFRIGDPPKGVASLTVAALPIREAKLAPRTHLEPPMAIRWALR